MKNESETTMKLETDELTAFLVSIGIVSALTLAVVVLSAALAGGPSA